ncbi:MAG TPA: CDP-glucose 4,6-dehydratase [Terriglobales bacterium]|nr:CDP-glucose 4,6-dehydratase [Terriglobales bacterium]
MPEASFWHRKKVFLTGHTGFMGGWLSSLLLHYGAKVTGYALAAPTDPSFCDSVGLERRIARSVIGDVRDLSKLTEALTASAAEVVFHLAAQPLVRTANAEPVLTYDVNVMGTVNLLEAVRKTPSVKAVVVVTTDKVYRNRNWAWPYREVDELGGSEPYSSSKSCAEHVLDAYRNVYFHSLATDRPAIGLASVRAGNVIGGGDWAADRLIPDAIRAFQQEKPLILRHPQSTRPWQHVLDPLPGYLTLAEELTRAPSAFSCGWNFGPSTDDAKPVGWIAQRMAAIWGATARVEIQPDEQIFEEKLLALDSAKAQTELRWQPRWRLDQALERTTLWYKHFYDGKDVWTLTERQIGDFLGEAA